VTRVGAALLVAGVLGGCSSLSPNDAGVSNLQIVSPICDGVEVGTVVKVDARTFDQHGDSVDAPVWWRTPDKKVIDVDSATGRITGLVVSDTARVQAIVGTKDPIISDLIPLVVTPRADTLTLTGSPRVTVNPAASGSPSLIVAVSQKASAAPVKAFPLVYRVVEPIFASSDARTVEFPGGLLTLTACSGPSGTPLAATSLNRRANQTQPDSAIVEVTAHHPDGSAVPGSGQRFTIIFLKP